MAPCDGVVSPDGFENRIRESFPTSREEPLAQQPGRLDRHADALGNDGMRFTRGITDAKYPAGESRTDPGPNRACGNPRAFQACLRERLANAATRIADVNQDRVAGGNARGSPAAALELVSPDAARHTRATFVGVHHAAVTARKSQQRHQPIRKSGVVEAGLEPQQVRPARCPP